MRVTVRNVQEQAHEDGAWTCAWVPGTDNLLTGAVDETVKCWTSAEEGLQHQHTYAGLAGHTLGVVSVAVDPTGTYAASSALDSFVRVWCLADHQEKVQLESQPTEVWNIAFGPQKDRCILAAAGGTSGKVKLWADITDVEGGVAAAPAELLVPQVRAACCCPCVNLLRLALTNPDRCCNL